MAYKRSSLISYTFPVTHSGLVFLKTEFFNSYGISQQLTLDTPLKAQTSKRRGAKTSAIPDWPDAGPLFLLPSGFRVDGHVWQCPVVSQVE